jgi:GT2 family glycosyltransferase
MQDVYENIAKIVQKNAPVTVIVNGFNAETVNYLRALKQEFANLNFFILNDMLPKSAARNRAIEWCDTDIIYWLDDDAYFTGGNIDIITTLFEKHHDVFIIGGPNLTPPEAKNFEILQGAALATFFVSGKMETRYKSAGKQRFSADTELILCNMAFKRELFTKYNLSFEPLLHYAEENLIITQAENLGLKALYAPDLIVYHSRRDSFFKLALQFFYSGYGRGLLPLWAQNTLKFYHLMPAAFVFYLVVLAYFGNAVLSVPAVLYAALNARNAFITCKTTNFKLMPAVVQIFFITFTVHFFYGTGIIFAFFTRVLWKITKK